MGIKLLGVLGLLFSMNLMAQPLEAQLARCLDEMESVNEDGLACQQDVRAASFSCRPPDRSRVLTFSPQEITIGVSELAAANPSLTAFVARRVRRPDAQINLQKLKLVIPYRDSLNCMGGSSFMNQCQGTSDGAYMEFKASYRSSQDSGIYENNGGSIRISSIQVQTSSLDESGADLLFTTQIVMNVGPDEIRLNLPQRFQSATDCR